jgi:hypothetical protein
VYVLHHPKSNICCKYFFFPDTSSFYGSSINNVVQLPEFHSGCKFVIILQGGSEYQLKNRVGSFIYKGCMACVLFFNVKVHIV